MTFFRLPRINHFRDSWREYSDSIATEDDLNSDEDNGDS